jgi:hypothetical protein
MNKTNTYSKKRSRESRAAIERLYITMRHLIIRGSYKPSGISGKALKQALLSLNPEIYGSVGDPEKVELNGLLYVAERLPKGIEECAILKLVGREGYEKAGYEAITPSKRRRSCYRVDKDRMYVEMSRGRSDIYDILTHLTFLFIEADKIKSHARDAKGKITSNWLCLQKAVEAEDAGVGFEPKKALVYLSNVLGRTLDETQMAVEKFNKSAATHSLYHFVYWLGQTSVLEEKKDCLKREVYFSAKLRDVIGHHVYGEAWAQRIKAFLNDKKWLNRPIHIISANLHSVRNTLYGLGALAPKSFNSLNELAQHTSAKMELDVKVAKFAEDNGLYSIKDKNGTNLDVQIIDTAAIGDLPLPKGITVAGENPPVLLVMDYAFGEQAFECMDELLKPYQNPLGTEESMLVKSISVMGKAGILEGNKGDIMLPSAHVFEGTADNYPLTNLLEPAHFKDFSLKVWEGPMITVLGTSLQNKDVLHHFLSSTWRAIGIEMEGAHYQKAIQSAARIRRSISKNISLRYAYYASDNPLKTGSTLSSGSLGQEGIEPTYAITLQILKQIFADTKT